MSASFVRSHVAIDPQRDRPSFRAHSDFGEFTSRQLAAKEIDDLSPREAQLIGGQDNIATIKRDSRQVKTRVLPHPHRNAEIAWQMAQKGIDG